mmetsp:Transcript_31934/g.51758  ORF Transcript_31934/g.51758 Transcript_31934/m.51758 type:complete len:209 (-) Transcript_31934:685-1311(-)
MIRPRRTAIILPRALRFFCTERKKYEPSIISSVAIKRLERGLRQQPYQTHAGETRECNIGRRSPMGPCVVSEDKPFCDDATDSPDNANHHRDCASCGSRHRREYFGYNRIVQDVESKHRRSKHDPRHHGESSPRGVVEEEEGQEVRCIHYGQHRSSPDAVGDFPRAHVSEDREHPPPDGDRSHFQRAVAIVFCNGRSISNSSSGYRQQ